MPQLSTIQCDHSLTISDEVHSSSQVFERNGSYRFHYEAKEHKALPHVVKFSGGRSSGMLLFTLLEAGLLNAARGDVVIFNNTSAEHPSTYEFSAKCKHLVEEQYGIPFFWIEAQTYEDARDGDWVRMASYRLVNERKRAPDNPDGYSWGGEVFEELLAWQGFVPNQFRRICTTNLKLAPTRAFLKDWFADKDEIARLGHHGNGSRLDMDRLYKRHRKSRGSVPFDIFARKKAFLETRPFFRPCQRFAQFSGVFAPFHNEAISGHEYGDSVSFGSGGSGGGVEYLAFIGLRYDEMRRVVRVKDRNSPSTSEAGYEGEHVYMPLVNMYVGGGDVEAFWRSQTWDLEIKGGRLSNCTFCFLKGANALREVNEALSVHRGGDLSGTPCDVNWWVRLEEEYGRDLVAEKRDIKTKGLNTKIGFFGLDTGFSYKVLADSVGGGADLSEFSDSVLPCDCTD